MFRSTAGSGFHEAGQCASPGHFGACFQVFPVTDSNRQIFGQQADGLQGIQVADRSRAVGDESFGCMEESIEALIGGQVWRDGNHQFRINDGKGWESARASEANFFLTFFIGNYRPRVGFRSGSGCCRYGYDGKYFLDRASLAGSSLDIVPVVTVVARHYGDGFG